MASLRADIDACQGYANCVENAEDYFDLDDDGVVVLRRIEVPEDQRKHVQAAVRSCPVAALRLEDE